MFANSFAKTLNFHLI